MFAESKIVMDPIIITGSPLTWWQAYREDVIGWALIVGSVILLGKLLANGGKGMKKFILALVLLVGIMEGKGMCQDIVNTPYGLNNLQGLNLRADTLYLPSSGSFAVGMGSTLATIYHNTLEVRGEWVAPVNSGEKTKWGFGVGVNIPALVRRFGGNWLVSGVDSNIGVTGLISIGNKAHIEPALYVTVVQIGL